MMLWTWSGGGGVDLYGMRYGFDRIMGVLMGGVVDLVQDMFRL